MGLFRRAKPLHERLATAGGVALPGTRDGRFGRPPGWDGGPSPYGEPGIHGVSRARRWDAVASAQAPHLHGDEVQFVSLPDRTLVVEGSERADAIAPLAAAIEETLPPPYRAEAVRRSSVMWAVAASRIEAIDAPDLEGDTIELTSVAGARTIVVDGGPSLQSALSLARVGEGRGSDYVVRAQRLRGALWEVEASTL